MQVWANGQLLDHPDQPVLSILDHGFTVGDGVFEAVKIVDDQPFALTLHLERLKRSAAGLGLPEFDEGLVRKGIEAVLAGGGLPLGRLRITYTGGPAPMGSGRGDAPPTVLGRPRTNRRRARAPG